MSSYLIAVARHVWGPDCELAPEARHIAVAVADHMNADPDRGPVGRAWPSLTTIAKRTGYARSTVAKHFGRRAPLCSGPGAVFQAVGRSHSHRQTVAYALVPSLEVAALAIANQTGSRNGYQSARRNGYQSASRTGLATGPGGGHRPDRESDTDQSATRTQNLPSESPTESKQRDQRDDGREAAREAVAQLRARHARRAHTAAAGGL